MTTKKTAAVKPSPAPAPVIDIDRLTYKLVEGKSLTQIAGEVGMSLSGLLRWVNDPAVPERSVRAREARAESAKRWDELAEERIDQAADVFELQKAKELAHHYRWRAAKIAPRDYGEKVALTDPDGGVLKIETIRRTIVDPKA